MKQDTGAPEEAGHARLPQVRVGMELPLWGLITAFSMAFGALVSLHFDVRDLHKSMQVVQAEVKSMNAVTIKLAQDYAILQYRVEKLETTAPARAADRR